MATFNEFSAVDPFDYDPRKAWNASKRIMRRMCEKNGIKVPEFFDETLFDQGPGSFGYYRPGELHVNVPNCSLPQRYRPVRKYSYTGWKADRTVPGVAAHELGHHFDCWPRCIYSGSESWLKVIAKGPSVSGYEPSPDEAWAESFRLFVLNPGLLRGAWPERFEVLSKRFQLEPIVKDDWEDVLMNAPAWYIEHGRKLVAKADARLARGKK